MRVPGTKPTRDEDLIQAGIVSLSKLVIPPHLGLMAAIPNGGKRNKTEAAILKEMGVTAGMPDLMLALWGGRIVWIEVKRPKNIVTGAKAGTLSPEQIDIHSKLSSMGHEVYVVDDVLTASVLIKRLIAEARTAYEAVSHGTSSVADSPAVSGLLSGVSTKRKPPPSSGLKNLPVSRSKKRRTSP